MGLSRRRLIGREQIYMRLCVESHQRLSDELGEPPSSREVAGSFFHHDGESPQDLFLSSSILFLTLII